MKIPSRFQYTRRVHSSKRCGSPTKTTETFKWNGWAIILTRYQGDPDNHWFWRITKDNAVVARCKGISKLEYAKKVARQEFIAQVKLAAPGGE